MLEPKNRLKLMEQLRPPDGYRLDRAIGTTFSLDLLALLIAPLSMVLFECENKDSALQDPTAILEALRLTTDKISIFCQKGRIAVPMTDSYLFSYLEPIIVEVEADNPGGVFHPKVWLMRYLNDEKSIRYRFLCLSRNLTFDRSWDTILTLDGEYDSKRQRAYSRNRPLSDFFSALPDISKSIQASIRKNVRLMADEVLRVTFEPPEQFDDIQFHPIGIAGYKGNLDPAEYDRYLIISPFLSDEIIKPLADEGKKNVIVSRPESFDSLNIDLLRKLDEKANLFIMEQGAEKPEDTEAEKAADDITISEEDPSGLHAKLYILESGWDAHIFTGSSNATVAGLKGLNVEFLTELVGKRSTVGIDVLMGKDAPEMSMQSLLVRYKIPEDMPLVDDVRKQLEKRLEEVRRMLLEANLTVRVTADADNKYAASMASKKNLKFPKDTKISCWPIMLPETYERDVSPLVSGQEVIFAELTLLALTMFYAFKVNANIEGKEAELRFVLTLPVNGMPDERNNAILQHIIGNGNRFIRYLLFLLSENPEQLVFDRIINNSGDTELDENRRGISAEIPLLEELVRAYSRHPEKIDRVNELISDLQSSEEGDKILPEGFDSVWNAFKEAISGGMKT